MNGLYSDDEFYINQQGHLSDRQKMQLTLRMYIWYGIAGFDILFMVVLIFIQILNKFIPPGYIFWYCLLIVAAFLGIRNTRPFLDDIQGDKIKTVSGKAYKKITSFSRSGYYTVRIEEQTFTVSFSLYRSLEQGRSYRFYYAPNSRILLRIDPL